MHAQDLSADEPKPINALDAPYSALLDGYILILGTLQMRLTFLRRVYAEVHIKRQLTLISKWLLYLRLSHSDVSGEYSAWIIDTRTNLESFLSTLSASSGVGRIARLSIVVVPPTLATIYALFGHQADPSQSNSVIGFLPQLTSFESTVILLPAGYAFFLIGTTFVGKRKMFLETRINGVDIYKLEDELFKVIGVTKLKEFPFDLALYIVAALAVIGNVVAFNWISGPDTPTRILGILMVPVILISVIRWWCRVNR
jgi:hypothetical protein